MSKSAINDGLKKKNLIVAALSNIQNEDKLI